ncbi:MAG: hypothetical protein KC766_30200 [Myxococcales bacterium]|nr:hypothetical protein [Myxococcales bacterium]
MNEERTAHWFDTLTPTPERLRELESGVWERVEGTRDADGVPSLGAEWAALLRDRPVANTLLVAASAAVLLASVPFGALAAAARLLA